MLCELRCLTQDEEIGKQTIVPSSIHETGEVIRFEKSYDGEPGAAEPDDLEMRVRSVAAASLLARHWPDRGERNQCEMALAGVLAHNGWEVGNALRFIRATYQAVETRDSSVKRMKVLETAVRNTFKRHADDSKKTTGIPTLKEIIDPEVVDTALEWLGIEKESAKENRTAQWRSLYDNLNKLEVFRATGGEVFATVPMEHRVEYLPIRSTQFKRHTFRMGRDLGLILGPDDQNKCVSYVDSNVDDGDDEREVFVRVGHAQEKVYLDLCDKQRRVVEIDAEGWRVLEASPVPFRRSDGMLPLPEPIKGGRIDDLFPFLNAEEAENRVLYVAWLLSVFQAEGDLPILTIQGEKDAAKSTTTRNLRRLVDDNTALLLRKPKDERDLRIRLSKACIGAYDNLSGMSQELSDTFCCITTGAGFQTRKLHTELNKCRALRYEWGNKLGSLNAAIRKMSIESFESMASETRAPNAHQKNLELRDMKDRRANLQSCFTYLDVYILPARETAAEEAEIKRMRADAKYRSESAQARQDAIIRGIAAAGEKGMQLDITNADSEKEKLLADYMLTSARDKESNLAMKRERDSKKQEAVDAQLFG